MLPNKLTETDIRSPDSEMRAVAGDPRLQRPWLEDSPVCLPLALHQILHLGVATMPDPFRIVRTDLGGSYFLASLDGEGRVLVDGKWQPSLPGQAFLLPPRTMNAFFTPLGKRWRFCWVRFREERDRTTVTRANSPVLARFDGQPLAMAIEGLRYECLGRSSAVRIEDWIHLIRGYVSSFALPNPADTRLWTLWESVAGELNHPWTIREMAAKLRLSEKQFQRLCQRELGRSPRQHLMWLRMRKAAELLLETNKKISSIAITVGYENPFVFSSTFKRMMGWTPSEYIKQHRDQALALETTISTT
jgi:AraC-like DNA-binding protein